MKAESYRYVMGCSSTTWLRAQQRAGARLVVGLGGALAARKRFGAGGADAARAQHQVLRVRLEPALLGPQSARLSVLHQLPRPSVLHQLQCSPAV